MTNYRRVIYAKRYQRAKQRQLRQQMKCIIAVLLIAVILLMIYGVTTAIQRQVEENNNVKEVHAAEETSIVIESTPEPATSQNEVEVVTSQLEEEIKHYPKFAYSKDWGSDDTYLLAKIAMAEAEGENIQTKTLVILAVLNRVWSDEFPDTIKEVIEQNSNGTYQFSPLAPGGRWYRVEPNEECYEAVRIVQEAIYDYSGGALYFESCTDEDNWHSRNLEFLYQSEHLRFYK